MALRETAAWTSERGILWLSASPLVETTFPPWSSDMGIKSRNNEVVAAVGVTFSLPPPPRALFGHNQGQPKATQDENFISCNIFDGDDLFALLKGENPIHHQRWKLLRHKGVYLIEIDLYYLLLP
jgi:hypothetical protein